MQQEPYSKIVKINPVLAASWLTKNVENNRATKPYKIASYSRDMAAGNWHLNGETIKFDTLGRLIDGQNRLHAVVASGATVENFVTFDLASASDVFGSIDAGTPRSFADRIKSEGIGNGKVLAAVVRRLLLWERGSRVSEGGQLTFSSDELAKFLAENSEVPRSAKVAALRSKSTLLPASVLGMCHYLFSQIDADQATWFFDRLADGDGLASTHAVAALKNRLIKERLSSGRIRDTTLTALVIRAWNAYRRNEPITKIQLPPGGLTAANYPVPE